jgi:predicted nicotinamide N-methyase
MSTSEYALLTDDGGIGDGRVTHDERVMLPLPPNKTHIVFVTACPQLSVVPLITLPLDPSTGDMFWGDLCENMRFISLGGAKNTFLSLEAVSIGLAGKLWDSTFVALAFLKAHPNIVRSKRVLELGSGTGALGLAISRFLDADSVCLTDVRDTNVLSLLNANIELNCGVASSKVTAEALPWGEEIVPDSPAQIAVECAEVVVASDCVYAPELYVPLFNMLDAVVTKERCCYLAHRKRNPRDSEFFDLFTEESGLSCVALSFVMDSQESDEIASSKSTKSDATTVPILESLSDVKIYLISRT